MYNLVVVGSYSYRSGISNQVPPSAIAAVLPFLNSPPASSSIFLLKFPDPFFDGACPSLTIESSWRSPRAPRRSSIVNRPSSRGGSRNLGDNDSLSSSPFSKAVSSAGPAREADFSSPSPASASQSFLSSILAAGTPSASSRRSKRNSNFSLCYISGWSYCGSCDCDQISGWPTLWDWKLTWFSGFRASPACSEAKSKVGTLESVDG